MLVASVLALVVSSCGYDDTAIWDKVNAVEDRVAKLEELCNKTNSDIEALRTIVTALRQNDYVVSVTPVIEGGKTIGYTITFAKSGEVTIYHGQDGKDGADGEDGKDGVNGDGSYIPNIGVKKDVDGIYYWTLDGEWLLDESGNKVPAQGEQGADGAQGEPGEDGQDGQDGQNGQPGKDGKDGVTPKLKIENDYWYVSYDNGLNWEKLGRAITDGSGGSSIFTDVYEQDGYIYFILSNGDSFKLPTSVASATLDVTFNVEQGVAIVPETTLKVEYTISGAVGKTWVRAIGVYDEGTAIAKPINNDHGYIYIFNEFRPYDESKDEPVYETIYGDTTYEDLYNNWMSVIVIVSDANGNQVTKALNFEMGVLKSVEDAYVVDSAAGTLDVIVETNVIENSFEVVIPEKAQSWLSYNTTRAELREDTLVFSVTENLDDKFRSATINLVNNLGQTGESFVIFQRSNIANDTVVFEDPRVEAICVARFDKNLDGRLTYEEIATVTDVKDLFLLDKKIVSFNEFEYFTAVTEIPDGLFANCKLLESVRLPESVTTIGYRVFENCESLTSIMIPEGVIGVPNSDFWYEDEGWFIGCSSLEHVKLPSTLKRLPHSCFYNCVSLKEITIPEGIDRIYDYCFYGCEQLSTLNIITPIKYIGSHAFTNCQSLKYFDLSSLEKEGFGPYSAFEGSGLTSVTIPETITRIYQEIFRNCKNLTDVSLHDNITWIGRGAFEGCSNLKNIKLPLNLETISSEAFANSGIEGEQIEGTSMKALIIPARVNQIGYDAFGSCSNLSAVKMLPMYPPVESRGAFDPYTTIYVHSDVVDDYKDSEDWGYYTILPYEMMSISLSTDFEITGEPTYYDGYFNFPVSVCVSGDIANADNVEEFGYFIKSANNDYSYDNVVTYYPVETLGEDIESIVPIGTYNMSYNRTEYIASAKCEVGAYIRLVDGSVVIYNKHLVEFIYDEKPSVEFLGYEITDRSIGSSSSYTTIYFSAEYKIYGRYWMNDIDVRYDYTGYDIDIDYSYGDDNTIIISGYWKYYNSEVDSTANIWIEYRDWDYNYYDSESFTLTTGDVPELNLEASVDWFTQVLQPTTKPIMISDGAIGCPWNAANVIWKGTDVTNLKYVMAKTSEYEGMSTFDIIYTMMQHDANGALSSINDAGYDAYFTNLDPSTSYTLCVYAVNAKGKKYFEMDEVTTAEVGNIETTNSANAWSYSGMSNYGSKFQVVGDNFSLDVHFQDYNVSGSGIVTGEYTWTKTSWWGYNDFEEFTTRNFTMNGESVSIINGKAYVSYENNQHNVLMILVGNDYTIYVIEYNGVIDNAMKLNAESFSEGTYNEAYCFHSYSVSGENLSFNLYVNDQQSTSDTIESGTYHFISKSFVGNEGYFSIDSFKVDGTSYNIDTASMVVSGDGTNLDITINITTTNGDLFEIKFVGIVGINYTKWNEFYISNQWDDCKYVVGESSTAKVEFFLYKLGGTKSDPLAAATYTVGDWENNTSRDYCESGSSKVNGTGIVSGEVVVEEDAAGYKLTFDVIDANGTEWKGTYVGAIN